MTLDELVEIFENALEHYHYVQRYSDAYSELAIMEAEQAVDEARTNLCNFI